MTLNATDVVSSVFRIHEFFSDLLVSITHSLKELRSTLDSMTQQHPLYDPVQRCVYQEPRRIPLFGTSLAWLLGMHLLCSPSTTTDLFDDNQAFPDWFAENTQAWWTEGLKNWTELGVKLSGIWLDMNEPSSFCSDSW